MTTRSQLNIESNTSPQSAERFIFCSTDKRRISSSQLAFSLAHLRLVNSLRSIRVFLDLLASTPNDGRGDATDKRRTSSSQLACAGNNNVVDTYRITKKVIPQKGVDRGKIIKIKSFFHETLDKVKVGVYNNITIFIKFFGGILL